DVTGRRTEAVGWAKARCSVHPRGQNRARAVPTAQCKEAILPTLHRSCAGLRAHLREHRNSAAERSAARLAHQSGGLGVPSSNLGAPTRLSPNYQCFSQVAGAALVCKMRTEGRQSAPTRTNSPEKVPNSVLQAFRRDSNGREKPFSCAPAPDKHAPETSPSKLSPEPG